MLNGFYTGWELIFNLERVHKCFPSTADWMTLKFNPENRKLSYASKQGVWYTYHTQSLVTRHLWSLTWTWKKKRFRTRKITFQYLSHRRHLSICPTLCELRNNTVKYSQPFSLIFSFFSTSRLIFISLFHGYLLSFGNPSIWTLFNAVANVTKQLEQYFCCNWKTGRHFCPINNS